MHIIIVGNPITGFDYIGPFENDDKARDYCDIHLGNCLWWIHLLEKPRPI